MGKYRTLAEVTEDYFKAHPEEIEEFLIENFEEYAKDGDSTALLSALRVVARVKGISAIADEVGITRRGVQKALSGQGNPRLDNINSIMRANRYRHIQAKKKAWIRGNGWCACIIGRTDLQRR